MQAIALVVTASRDHIEEAGVEVELLLTYDRDEGDLAVLLLRDDECTKVDFPRALLPEEAKPGCILKFLVQVDESRTEDAHQRVQSILDRLLSQTD